MKNSGEVATETVKYLTLFTASLDKNQIYFLVKKSSSTHFMCTDSGRFIAAHWNKGFHMWCSGENILTICSCLPPVSFTHSVNFTAADGISQARKNPGIPVSFHVSRPVPAGAARCLSLPCVPKDPQMGDWGWVTADTWQQVKRPLLENSLAFPL